MFYIIPRLLAALYGHCRNLNNREPRPILHGLCAPAGETMEIGTRTKTILLVEDDFLIAAAEAKALERYGYAVTCAGTGEKAVALFETEGSIDLILMDIDLGPGMDGTRAAEVILAGHDIPIVFVSSHSEREIVEKTERITSYGYVVKGSSITVLDASIKMAFKLFAANQGTKRANEKLVATFRALPDLLFEVGLDGYYYGYHSSHDELLYRELPQLMGKCVAEVLPPQVAGIIMSAIEEANTKGISTGKSYELEVPAGLLWFEITVSRIASYPDRPHFILLCRDVTERKQREESFERRIATLTSPEAGSEDIRFSDLFSLEEIQQLQDDFSNATGVASIITDIDGTPITAPSNFCRLCSDIIRKTRVGASNCLKSDACIGRLNTATPNIQICLSGGLWDAGAGISVGGRHVANWLIGQVRDETQTEEKMLEYAKTIGAEGKRFIDAFREVPSMSTEKFAQIATVLFRLANQLSTAAYNNIQQARFLSERRRAEDELRDSEKALSRQNRLFSSLLESSPEIIVFALDSEYRYLAFNGKHREAIQRMWGTSIALGMSMLDVIGSHDDRLSAQANFDRALAGESFVLLEEHGDAALSRESWLDYWSPIRNENGEVTGLTCFCLNHTELVKVQESLGRAERELRESDTKYSRFVENATDGVFVADERGRYLEVNRAASEITGYSRDELLTMSVADFRAPESQEGGLDTFRRLLEDGLLKSEARFRHRDGSLRWWSVDAIKLSERRFFAITKDITERKKSEELIHALLSEKELLLRETHHRIKNNMNTIHSLLSLQADSASDACVRTALEDAGRRMQSMLVLYAKLYQSVDFASISIKDYLPALIDEIVANFPRSRAISVTTDIADLVMDASLLQSLGIITNELITNSMKYAWGDSQEALLSVSVGTSDGAILLCVRDNGVGIPDAFDPAASSGFGMRLIEGLARQKNGSFTIENDGGTRAVVRLEALPYSPVAGVNLV